VKTRGWLTLLLLVAILVSSCEKSLPEPAAPVSPAMQPAIRVGVDHFVATRVTMVQPRLPEAAKRLGAKGPVVLEIKIDEAGTVADVRVLRGHPTLDRSAEDAVKQWKYEPLLFEGRPTAVWITVLVNFTDQ
jgi:TonB family protein